MDITIRPATRSDLVQIVRLLADDVLGQTREVVSDPVAPAYLASFEAINADPNHILAVACQGGTVVGFLQLSFLPGLSRRGTWRGQIEGVRVADAARGQRLGERLFEWAIAECRTRGCTLVQLTSDQARIDAHRFYARLGFEPSHVGFKLNLTG